MIGNDIVDLKVSAIESNWKRKGYLQKVFTAYERHLILTSFQPDVIVWTLWAMKEAVYKACFRQTPVRKYAPSKIKCLNIEVTSEKIVGSVCHNHLIFYTETFLLNDYLHTIACMHKKDLKKVKRIEVENYPADYLSFLKEKNLLSPNEYIIKNSFGVPCLTNTLRRRTYPLSISHHGSYLGVALIHKELS